MGQIAIAVAAYIAFNLFVPMLWERVVTSAPEWALKVVMFGGTMLCLVVVIAADPILAILKAPRSHSVTSSLIVAIAAAITIGSAWWLFVAYKSDVFTLGTTLTSSAATYPAGTQIAGIRWSEK